MNIVGIFMALLSVHIFGGLAFNVFENCPDWLSSEICNDNITATVTVATLNSTMNGMIVS